jgi:outer membrane lipoprotein-sorting protein
MLKNIEPLPSHDTVIASGEFVGRAWSMPQSNPEWFFPSNSTWVTSWLSSDSTDTSATRNDGSWGKVLQRTNLRQTLDSLSIQRYFFNTVANSLFKHQRFFRRIVASLILCLICFCLSICEVAAQPSSHDRRLITEIQNYLNSLHNITGKFTQIDSKGHVQSGQFFLSKPGKLRWEYQRPKAICILMNGDKILYRDQRLNQTYEYQSPGFMLQLLTSEQINLFTSAVTAKTSGASVDLYVTMPSGSSEQTPQTFIMRFSKNPLELLGLTLSDGTKIRITTIIKYPKLSDKIFTLQ